VHVGDSSSSSSSANNSSIWQNTLVGEAGRRRNAKRRKIVVMMMGLPAKGRQKTEKEKRTYILAPITCQRQTLEDATKKTKTKTKTLAQILTSDHCMAAIMVVAIAVVMLATSWWPCSEVRWLSSLKRTSGIRPWSNMPWTSTVPRWSWSSS
jgi:hypothetical protein